MSPLLPRKELDGWEPEDDPWAEHISHAKGNCAFINLGKKPCELTVADVSYRMCHCQLLTMLLTVSDSVTLDSNRQLVTVADVRGDFTEYIPMSVSATF